jgi:hypothetical protein
MSKGSFVAPLYCCFKVFYKALEKILFKTKNFDNCIYHWSLMNLKLLSGCSTNSVNLTVKKRLKTYGFYFTKIFYDLFDDFDVHWRQITQKLVLLNSNFNVR